LRCLSDLGAIFSKDAGKAKIYLLKGGEKIWKKIIFSNVLY
jgi:hypothetical protein